MPRLSSWMPWLIATALVAQQPTEPKPAPPASAAARLEALQAERTKLMEDFIATAKAAEAKAKEAKSAGTPAPAMPSPPDWSPLIVKAKAAAADYAGTDDAVMFLLFVLQMGAKQDEVVDALDTLTDKHIAHKALVELGRMIPYLTSLVPNDKAKVFIERMATIPDANVRGWVTLARHQPTIETADRAGEAYRTARTELLAAAELVTDAGLKSEIRTAIDTREQFGIGNVAPDIEGQDLDGVAFKLSDYQGKVVFLDFWGDW